MHSYVRVKRKNQIFFVHTSPNDTFAHVKSEIAQAVGDDDVSPEKMRLFVEPKADPGDAKTEGKGKAAQPKGPIPRGEIVGPRGEGRGCAVRDVCNWGRRVGGDRGCPAVDRVDVTMLQNVHMI